MSLEWLVLRTNLSWLKLTIYFRSKCCHLTLCFTSERTLIRISTAGCWNKAKFTFVPVLFSWLEIKKSHPRILAGFNQPKPANRPLFLPVTRFYWLPDFLCVPDSRPNRSRLILVSVSVFFFFFVSPSSETKAIFFFVPKNVQKHFCHPVALSAKMAPTLQTV